MLKQYLSRRKNLLSFLSLFCVIIILPCSVITSYASTLITQKLHTNTENYLHSSSITLDNLFQSAVTQAELLRQNNSADYYTLLYAKDMRQPDVITAAYHFNNTIKSIPFNQDFFCDAFIYFKNPDMVFASDGTYDSATFFEQHRIFKDYPADYFERLMQKSYKHTFCPPTDILTKDSASEASLRSHATPFAINLSGSKPCDAVLVLLLDTAKLNAVSERTNITKTSYLYILDTQTKQFLNRPAETNYAALLGLDKQNYKSATGSMTLAHEDNYRILWQKSSVNRLLYLCVEPKPLIVRQIQSFLWTTIFLVLFLFVVCTYLYYHFSTRIRLSLTSLWNQIRQLSDNTSAWAVKAPDTLNVAAITKAAQTLQKQKEENLPQMLHAFLSQLFQGTMDAEEIRSFCRRFSLFPYDKHFLVFVMQTNFYLWEKPYESEESSVFFANTKRLLSQFGYTLAMNTPSSFAVILSARKQKN